LPYNFGAVAQSDFTFDLGHVRNLCGCLRECERRAG
jgi:hypothetical protein